MDFTKLYTLYKAATGITTDTRKVQQGNIFFALKGERFNGNEFATKALDAGATYAVIDEADKKTSEQYILVENVLETLQALARYHRQQMNIPVIAITGTNGKTTTKELVHAVLHSTYKTHYTQGNLNNHIGVPLTLLDMPLDTEIAIIEMGANHQGEINFLCQIAEPSHGLVTNVGKAHLEGFGSFEGVIATKSELYQYIAATNGVAFVNQEETHLSDMAITCSQQIKYSSDTLHVLLLGNTPFVEIELQGEKMASQLIGAYNYPNLLTAIALGTYFNVDTKKIAAALSNYTPQNNRSQWIQQKSNSIILDAYNANPSSMKVAIDNFATLKAAQKVAILGDMLELGTESETEHQKIIQQVKKANISFITVGNEFLKVNPKTGYKNIQDLAADWNWDDHKDTTFLMKGSRGIKIEQLLTDVTN